MPEGDTLEGEVWLGVAFVPEYRLMLSFKLAATESALAEPLIADAEKRFKPGTTPIWVSDGLDAYGQALRNRHCTL